MLDVLVIADDITGALDTATQFSKYGLSTVAYTSAEAFLRQEIKEVQVCVVNTDSRHMKPEEAYAAVKQIVQMGRRKEVRYIYKKTDSALRGNIGKEIEAVLDGAENERIYFAPAYPKIQRVTIGGIQYYAGKPISESVYRKDPMEPVRCSNITQIIALQSNVNVIKKQAEQLTAAGGSEKGVILCDAETEQQLDVICMTAAKQTGTVLMAGCAGFAERLAASMKNNGGARRKLPAVRKLLLVSGSLNAASIKQISRAKESGIPCISLREAVEMPDTFFESDKYHVLIEAGKEILQKKKILMLESASDEELDCVLEQINGKNCKKSAEVIAGITRDLLQDDEDYALTVFGGDTLLAISEQMLCGEIEPVREITSGIPISLARDRKGRERVIVTKSGGFGEENVVKMICDYLDWEGKECK